MAESVIQLTEGVGKKAHTWQRTIGANNVEDAVAILGEPYVATYSMLSIGTAVATANSHLLQIMAGSSLNVRVRRVTITQGANAGGVAIARFQLVRLTTAGTGGSAVTAGKFDNGDAAAGATGMTLPTAKGTEGSILYSATLGLRASVDAGETTWIWEQHPASKPIIIPSGVANGLAVKSTIAEGSASVDVVIEFVETSFL